MKPPIKPKTANVLKVTNADLMVMADEIKASPKNALKKMDNLFVPGQAAAPPKNLFTAFTYIKREHSISHRKDMTLDVSGSLGGCSVLNNTCE